MLHRELDMPLEDFWLYDSRCIVWESVQVIQHQCGSSCDVSTSADGLICTQTDDRVCIPEGMNVSFFSVTLNVIDFNFERYVT